MSTQATIYGVISTLEKYTTEDAKRTLFQMAQDMDRAYDTQVQRLSRKAEVFDQLDAYGCSSASHWLDLKDEVERLRAAGAQQKGWISVEERLPEDGQSNLAVVARAYSPHIKDTDICTDLHTYIHPGRWIAHLQSVHTRGVTHWMALPPKPDRPHNKPPSSEPSTTGS